MIKVCDNEQELRSVVMDDPEMFNRLSFDGIKIDITLLDRGLWIKWTEVDSEEIKALLLIESQTAYAIEVHIHIPKKFRGKGTIDKGFDFLRWIVSNSKGKLLKIHANIPVIHRDVILYTMKLGFKREGTSRKSIIKGGVLMDMANMGITFEEVLNGRI